MNTAKKITTTELGRYAERIAGHYFKSLGAIILEQNLRVKKYEIDLIVDLNLCITQVYCFIEDR